MDIKKDFTDSFELLKHHKEVVIPVIVSLLIPLLLIGVFFQVSGLSPLMKEYYQMRQDFDEMRASVPDRSIMDDEDALFDQYLKDQAYDESKWMALFTWNNLWLLVGFIIAGVLGAFYFSCMSYGVIAFTVQNKEIRLDELLHMTGRFAVRFFSMRLLLSLLFIAPLAALGALAALAFFANVFLGVASIFLLILVFLAYIIIFTIRMFFATPSMYVDDQGPIDSIKHSYQLTKSHIGEVLIIFFIMYAIAIFINSFMAQPLQSAFMGYLLGAGVVKMAVNILLVVLFLLIESIAFTLEHIFFFYSYIDFKNEVKDG